MIPAAAAPPVPIPLGPGSLFADVSGALWWPDQTTLIVADLHLEKGTSFARRGVLLPPYDTRTTLARLSEVADRLRPTTIVALGDSFHDRDAATRLDPADFKALGALVEQHDWVWMTGNHDPLPPAELGGRVMPDGAKLGPAVLRHEALPIIGDYEISGHFHPKATVRIHGRRLSCRCFVAAAERILLPAFGAYAGGLEVSDRAIRGLFTHGFTAYLMGQTRLLAIGSSTLFGAEGDIRAIAG